MTVWRTWALLAVLLTASPLPSRAQDQAPERQVYRLPKNAYPHDVAPAPDGKVWYSAQQIGALGILDPKTGGARHVPLAPCGSRGRRWTASNVWNAPKHLSGFPPPPPPPGGGRFFFLNFNTGLGFAKPFGE